MDAKPLSQKSLHQLRGIAQSFGVTDIFEKDARQLAQEINIKQGALAPPPAPPIPQPPYDARLMSKPPARVSKAMDVTELLAEHIKRGLSLRFDDNGERWFMVYGKKNDEGTMRMPLKTVLDCANKVMR